MKELTLPNYPLPIKKLGIIGLGLMGASIGLAVKQNVGIGKMWNPEPRAHGRAPRLLTVADEAVSERVLKKSHVGSNPFVRTTHVVAKLMGQHREEGSPHYAEPVVINRLDVTH